MKTLKTHKDNLVDLELAEVFPNIFAVKIADDYDRAMLFFRYQEYYESPFEQFRGKDFDIFEYMRFYQQDRGKCMFTYTDDWTGYNIPSYALEACLKGVSVPNSYDKIMLLIHEAIRSHTDKPFYLLGVDNFESWVMQHEIAHGLFYVNEEYKSEMLQLWNETPEEVKIQMRDILIDLGYCDDVVPDEAQAYFSTGLTDKMKVMIMITQKENHPSLNELEEKYQTVFKKYKNEKTN